MRISRQKIYDSLQKIKEHYTSFDQLVLYVSYTPYQGVRLNVRIKAYARKRSWMKNTLEVTDCLHMNNLFEMADAIATEVEIWLKNNDF